MAHALFSLADLNSSVGSATIRSHAIMRARICASVCARARVCS
jgi:hypothetical protein